MLPTPEIRVWSSSARLTPVRRRRSAADHATGSNAGSNGSGATCAERQRHAVRRQPVVASDRPPNVRWSTNRSSGPPSAKRNRARRCGPSGVSRSDGEELPGHAEVGEQLRAVVERQPQVLAAAAGRRRLDGRPAGRRSRPARADSGAACGRRRPRPSRISRPTTQRSSPARTVSTSGSSGMATRLVRRVGRQRGPRLLGRELLGFLLAVAATLADLGAAEHDLGVERLLVVRAALERRRTPASRAMRSAASSCSEVFQSRPAPRVAASSSAVGEQPQHERAGRLGAAVEVVGADDRLDRVGDDRGLVAPAAGLLAAAELDVTDRARWCGRPRPAPGS